MTKITTIKESNKYTLNLKVATMEISRCMIDCCMIDWRYSSFGFKFKHELHETFIEAFYWS